VAAGPGYKPIRASALNFYELFRESNNRLAREYFKKDRLFDERFDSYPNCEADPDIRAASSLLSEYFEHRYVE